MKPKDKILGQYPVMCNNKGNTCYVSLSSAMAAMEEYARAWRERCLAAEDYIAKTPGDPDITEQQVKAYEKWQRLVEADPDVKDERDEHAKQQAIAFAIDYARRVLTWGYTKPEDVASDRMDVRYDQFIESQNK